MKTDNIGSYIKKTPETDEDVELIQNAVTSLEWCDLEWAPDGEMRMIVDSEHSDARPLDEVDL